MNSEITEEEVKAANRRFDKTHPNFTRNGARIPSAWKAHKLIVGKPITDKQVAEYRAKGYYSDDMKKAREAYLERKRRYYW